MSTEQVWRTTPAEFERRMRAVVQKRSEDRKTKAWELCTLINGIGMRKEPLEIEDLLPLED